MSPAPRREELPAGVHFAGQAPDCAIRLRGAGIAARHLRIEMAPDGTYRLADLGGSAGTRVNGERVVVAAGLGGDDVLRVGDSEFTVHLATPSQDEPLPASGWQPQPLPRAASSPPGSLPGAFIQA
ncbi:MAG: FHA domain-containing protein, partial [Gammaproteobacteria bacterium]